MLNIAIIGSRDFSPLSKVDNYLQGLLEFIPRFKVITGGARGVDKEAENFCAKNNISCQIIRPIDKTNKTDYLFRNIEILTKADIVVAFWEGKSRGTKFVIDYCNARDIPLKIIQADGRDSS